MLQSINPATGQLLKEIEPLNPTELPQKVLLANQAQAHWKNQSIEYRQAIINNVGKLLKDNASDYAQLLTEEMGKLNKEAVSEVEKCAWLCEYYAQNAATLLQDESVKTDYHKSYVSYQPLGVILGVMPWNFPFWQVFRFAIPTLLAGNTCLLKHASNVPQCAQLIEEIFKKAKIDEHCFINLAIKSEHVEGVIHHHAVKGVSLTGSTAAGKSVAKIAGGCIKPSLLELGGSDPYIVLQDADLDLAVEKCVTSRLLNAGQSCISAKRFIVEAPVYDEFVEKFQAAFEQVEELAPLATESIRDELHQQVQKSIEKGATCLLGGKLPEGDGYYYQPTILTDLQSGMPAYEEELFGPVASIFKVESEDEAVSLANQSDFGLGGAIFSKDIAKAEKLARSELQSGAVSVNDFVKSDPRLPFGGVKQSGYGRELAQQGLLAFTNVKTICINK